MKKLLAMVLAAVMVLSLCSCATAEETVALRVWVGDNADLPWINSVIENFKAAHPEKTYDISVDIQAEGDCSKRVLNDTEAAADVFTFADDQFNSLMNAEALQQVMVDADEIITANGGANAGAVQASTGADGNLYAYPATADNGYFMFYNKEYFTAEDVQTLDGILAAAEKAGKKFNMDVANGWYLASFFLGNGCQLTLDADGKQICDFNNEKGLAAAEAIKALCEHPAFLAGGQVSRSALFIPISANDRRKQSRAIRARSLASGGKSIICCIDSAEMARLAVGAGVSRRKFLKGLPRIFICPSSSSLDSSFARL